MRILKKALPIWSAFFVFCFHTSALAGQCDEPARVEVVDVVHVYDGDTVKLADGRRVRIIGINAPETAKDGQPSEPFADQSSRYLQTLLKDKKVSLKVGASPKDRYNRTLGHLYADGKHIGMQLLSNGLAYHIAIPPNMSFVNCLKAAEDTARRDGQGLWSQNPVRVVESLKDRESGFRLLRGRVFEVKKIRSGWVIEIGDQLAVKLSPALGQQLGGKEKLQSLKGKSISVRGWIKPKSPNAPSHYQPWFMSINHRAHIQF